MRNNYLRVFHNLFSFLRLTLKFELGLALDLCQFQKTVLFTGFQIFRNHKKFTMPMKIFISMFLNDLERKWQKIAIILPKCKLFYLCYVLLLKLR